MTGDTTIFSSNTTKLAPINVEPTPAAHGVNAARGVMEALIESANQDMKLYQAMLKVDAAEMKIKKSGSYNESTLVTLREGAVSRIFKELADSFKWLAGKLRAIGRAIINAFYKITNADKQIIETYEPKIKANSETLKEVQLEDMVLFDEKSFSELTSVIIPDFDMDEAAKNDEDDDIIYVNKLLKKMFPSANDTIMSSHRKSDSAQVMMVRFTELYVSGESPIKPQNTTISKLGGADVVLNKYKQAKISVDNISKAMERKSKDLDQQAARVGNIKQDKYSEQETANIVRTFGFYKAAILSYYGCILELAKTELAQYRKATKSMIGKVNNVSESAIRVYNDFDMADFEEAFNTTTSDDGPVDKELSKAADDNDIEGLTGEASTKVSDCPNTLTYDKKDTYSQSTEMGDETVAGTKDIDLGDTKETVKPGEETSLGESAEVSDEELQSIFEMFTGDNM